MHGSGSRAPMPRHAETRRLPYSCEQMFDLVADVGRYAEFLPWVTAIRVRSNSETQMVADMIVGFKGLRETFTSKVEKHRPNRITVEYLDGPLKYLRNEWEFRADGPGQSGGQSGGQNCEVKWVRNGEPKIWIGSGEAATR